MQLVFIDLKKALDTINHNILVNKVECMGSGGQFCTGDFYLDWFDKQIIIKLK